MPPKDYYKSKSLSSGPKPGTGAGGPGGRYSGGAKPGTGAGGPGGRYGGGAKKGTGAGGSPPQQDRDRANLIKELDELIDRPKKDTKKDTKKDNILTKIKNTIMGGTPTGDPDAQTKKDWIAAGKKLPGEHKLRTQYNRLLAKYGDAWGKTTQAKDLLGYLAGVPVERGGGLGLRDATYGGLTSWDQLNSESEAYRQQLLNRYSGVGSLDFAERAGKDSTWLRDIDIEKARGNLTPDQYFRFRQQLMAADPTPGNLGYKGEFPYSSGYAPGKLMTPVMSSIKDLLGIKDKQHPEYRGEPLDPALLNALYERGEILDPFARDESTHELSYNTRYDTGDTDPEDTTPPGDENQWATAGAGQIGWTDPYGNYQWGTMDEYSPYAQVNLAKDGGIIGLDGGGYLDDYRAADSLMFKDPQEDEEWEYNV